jgi:ectoine hydroxylase-related dioxygenase (phytanoyl-CoA dioxygenase family)
MNSTSGITSADPQAEIDQPPVFEAIQRIPEAAPGNQKARLEEIRSLGLERYIVELETVGYTVVPPGVGCSGEEVRNIHEAVMRILEERTGNKHSVDGEGKPGSYKDGLEAHNQFQLYYMLMADRACENWLDNKVLRAIIDYALRGKAQLCSMVSFVKWRDGGYGNKLGLHTDSQGGSPEGVLTLSHQCACNVALALTPYTREDGALAVIPGSHLYFRQPGYEEGANAAVPVEAPVGSMIFWLGNLWHGAFPKTTSGLRLNLTGNFNNRAFKTLENYGRHVPLEMLRRHDLWFARTLGADEVYGWGAEGPQPPLIDSI